MPNNKYIEPKTNTATTVVDNLTSTDSTSAYLVIKVEY